MNRLQYLIMHQDICGLRETRGPPGEKQGGFLFYAVTSEGAMLGVYNQLGNTNSKI